MRAHLFAPGLDEPRYDVGERDGAAGWRDELTEGERTALLPRPHLGIRLACECS